MVHRDCPDHRHQIDKSRWRLIKGSKMPCNLLQLNCRTFLFDSLFLNESNSIKRENHPHKQISNTHRSLFGCSLFSYSVVSSPSSFSSSSPYNITVVLQQHSTWACVCCHFDRWDHVCAPSIFDCVACASVRLCVCVCLHFECMPKAVFMFPCIPQIVFCASLLLFRKIKETISKTSN